MKPWYASKTLIAALLVGALAALNALTETVSDPEALSWFAFGVAILNGALRWLTSEPIGRTPSGEDPHLPPE